MLSGILEILVTISRISPAFFTGSLLASLINNETLKLIKSCDEFSKYSFSAVSECFFAKLSGSSPSGKVTTLTFIPCSRIKSIPLIEALIPAASPSNNTVIFFVSLLTSLI